MGNVKKVLETGKVIALSVTDVACSLRKKQKK